MTSILFLSHESLLLGLLEPIVNVASKAALDHAAGAAAYSASKSAAVALLDSLAADLKGSGVRVNADVVNAADGVVIWSKPFQSDRQALSLLAGRIASDIVADLRIQLSSPQEMRQQRQPTADAYDA